MPKHQELHETRKFQIRHSSVLDDDIPVADYRTTSDFIGYRLLVETMLRRAKRPLCTRDIHIALGAHAVVRWTLDAIEASNHVTKTPGYIDRYEWTEANTTQWEADLFVVNPRKHAGWNDRIFPNLGI